MTVAWCDQSQTFIRCFSANLAIAAGCDSDSSPREMLTCLQDKDAQTIQDLIYATDVVGDYTVDLYPFVTTVDGEVLQV